MSNPKAFYAKLKFSKDKMQAGLHQYHSMISLGLPLFPLEVQWLILYRFEEQKPENRQLALKLRKA
jgi:hypothetical protein